MSSSMVTERNTSTIDLVDVLPLVFQHSCISSAVGFRATLCSLLCTSQQAAQAVEQNCIGRVHLRAEWPEEMAWFGKHWRLVHSLEAETGFRHVATREAFEEGLAAAAAAARCAAAGTAGAAQVDPDAVQLRSVKAMTCPHAALSHLQAFTTLTSLSFDGLSDIPKVEPFSALAGLTSLRCLTISTEAGSLLPGTSSLTNLTSLSVGQVKLDCVPHLRHLPPQLQELTITFCSSNSGLCYPCVDFSHVTGLTRLTATSAREAGDPGYGLTVGQVWRMNSGARDKLPPNCRHLSVTAVSSAQPLLELQQLERLEIDRYYPAQAQSAVQQLSSLSCLSDLQINMKAGTVSAGTLQGLPALRGLRLWHNGQVWGAEKTISMDRPVLRKLAELSTLQRLSMQDVMLPNSSTCKLAEVFGSLCGLHSLWLSGCVVEGDCDYEDAGNCTSAQFAGVVGAIAGLPELHDLRLVRLSQWDGAASAALAAATQLTGLLVSSQSHWNDEFVSLVGQVHKLVGLRSLWMNSENMKSCDLAAAATSLVALTELCLPKCDPQQLCPWFPGAALGRVKSMHLWHVGLVNDPCDTAVWGVQWWSPADGDWV